MNKPSLKLSCVVSECCSLPPPSPMLQQQGVCSCVLWCRWFCRLFITWLASQNTPWFFNLINTHTTNQPHTQLIFWVKFLLLLCYCFLVLSLPDGEPLLPPLAFAWVVAHVPRCSVFRHCREGDKEQDSATNQLQELLCLSVYIWEGLFIDCLTLFPPIPFIPKIWFHFLQTEVQC